MNKPSQPAARALPARRRLLAALAAGGGVVVAGKGLPEHWGTPVVDAVSLPAHAAATGDAFTGSQPVTIVHTDRPSSAADGTGGLARFFETPGLRPQRRGLAARIGDRVVPAAQAGPEISSATLDLFAQVAGDVVTLLQLRLRIRVRIPGGASFTKDETPKKCEIEVDERLQILFQRTNLQEGDSPVVVSAVNCPEFEFPARIASISPTAVEVEVQLEGDWGTFMLTPGGSPFPAPQDCLAQYAALGAVVAESCAADG